MFRLNRRHGSAPTAQSSSPFAAGPFCSGSETTTAAAAAAEAVGLLLREAIVSLAAASAASFTPCCKLSKQLLAMRHVPAMSKLPEDRALLNAGAEVSSLATSACVSTVGSKLMASNQPPDTNCSSTAASTYAQCYFLNQYMQGWLLYAKITHIRRIYTCIYGIYVYSLYFVYNPRMVLGARPHVGFHLFTCHSIDLAKTKTPVLFNL